MSEAAIQARSLSKRYKMYPRPSARLVEWVSCGRTIRHSDFWALRDFNLDVAPGECVGLIGPNGAGKSTLLKILSGTISPTAGSFNVNGKVLSLLELGTGFSPELTGRQNVIETASLLGFRDGYVGRWMEEIVDFAGLGAFFDRTLRTYSSGMSVRLAFSMFACMKPDVFIVDEALAVGDVGFQRKCFNQISKMLNDGMTCLLVTHDLAAVTRFCRRAIVLNKGEILFEGEPRAAANCLSKLYFGEAAPSISQSRYGDGTATIEEIWFEDDVGGRITSSPARIDFVFCYTVRFNKPVDDPVCGFHIKTIHGVDVTLVQSNDLGYHFGAFQAGDRLTLRWMLSNPLIAGHYFFGCGCRYALEEKFMDRRVDAMEFPIVDVRQTWGIVDPIQELKIKIIRADASREIAANISGETAG